MLRYIRSTFTFYGQLYDAKFNVSGDDDNVDGSSSDDDEEEEEEEEDIDDDVTFVTFRHVTLASCI